jgi:cytochrome c oxidase subunit 2
MATLAAALWRQRQPSRNAPLDVDVSRERRMTLIIGGAVVFTCISVLILTGFSYRGQKRFYTARPETLTIKLTGHKWWWEVRYEEAPPSRIFTTANEMHIPVGDRITDRGIPATSAAINDM